MSERPKPVGKMELLGCILSGVTALVVLYLADLNPPPPTPPKDISSATGTLDSHHRLKNLVVTVNGKPLTCQVGIGREIFCYSWQKPVAQQE